MKKKVVNLLEILAKKNQIFAKDMDLKLWKSIKKSIIFEKNMKILE